jgi:CheY-like chemotaxis protein
MAKILLVEDNEMNRDMLSRRLLRRGFEVVTAVDGREGVTVALSELPDLILMDMNMPVLDGWEATREIKAAPQTAIIPIIALTAHAMSGDREKGMAAGCDDYETKPVEFDRLLGKINALLKIEPEERDAAPVATPEAASAMPPIQIDGLDYAAGLRRAGNDDKFYRQLLTRFVADFSHAPTAFAEWIANANWIEAERQAHTLKGLAGSLGANVLVPPATELEKFCKAGQREQAVVALEQLAPVLASLLASLLEQLNVHLHVPAPAETPSPSSLPPDCLPRLRKLLAESDPGAAELWAEHQAAFAAALPLQTTQRITAALENFDLDAALALLAELPTESSIAAKDQP